MKRLGIGVVIVAALAALAWWLWPRGRGIETALPAGTVSVALLDDPTALAQRLDALSAPLAGKLGRLDKVFTREGRAARLGFEPTEGFASIGLGDRGAAVARLSRLEPGVVCLDIADRGRFQPWLARMRGKDVTFADKTVQIGAVTFPWIERNGWTCIAGAQATPDQLATAFEDEERLADAPLNAALPDGPGLRGAWSAREATRWAHHVRRDTLARDLGHLAAYVETAVTRLHDAIEIRIDLTTEGAELADRLFRPAATSFQRYLAREGWAAARLSLALETAPETLATAMLPSTPATTRQAISLGRMALPMTAGVTWNQLVEALDGQIAMAVDVRVEGPRPPRLLLLGVKDATAAKRAVEAVARKFGEGGGLFGAGAPKTETIAGVTTYRLGFKGGDAWVHLADGAIIVASAPAALTSALQGARDAAPAWAVLDAPDAVLALAGDLAAVRARLPAETPTARFAQRLGLAIRRTPTSLELRTDAQSGVDLDTLVGLGLWTAGRR